MVITFMYLFGLFGGLTLLALGVAFLSDVYEAVWEERTETPSVIVLPAFQADDAQAKYGSVRELESNYYSRAA